MLWLTTSSANVGIQNGDEGKTNGARVAFLSIYHPPHRIKAVTDKMLTRHGSWQTSVSITLHTTNTRMERLFMGVDLRVEEVIFQ
jgi:hypothetical protein